MKEEVYYLVDSLGVAQPETIETPAWTVSRFFVEGGMLGMSLITVFLILLLLAAWKAPRWVKEIGIGALVVSIFWTGCGIFQLLGVMELFGDEMNIALYGGGIKVAMISLLYGLIVYFISLVIRVIQKPRI